MNNDDLVAPRVGFFYTLRNGMQVGPILFQNGFFYTEKSVDGFVPMWNSDGSADFFSFLYAGKNFEFDIIAEVLRAPECPE